MKPIPPGQIYLEPRSEFDRALVDTALIHYGFDQLIDLLGELLDCDMPTAVDYYCFNIEPLIRNGLVVIDESYTEYEPDTDEQTTEVQNNGIE